MFTDAASLYVISTGDGGAPSRMFAFAAQHRNPAEFLIPLPTTAKICQVQLPELISESKKKLIDIS